MNRTGKPSDDAADRQSAERRVSRPDEADTQENSTASTLRQDMEPARLGAELVGERGGGKSETERAMERATAVQGHDE